LLDPSLAPLFWHVEFLGAANAWRSHVPFAHWLVSELNPRVLVELGTHTGVSYSAMCQAVQRRGLATRCYAVDTWRGDSQTGLYGEEIYEQFRRFHDERFGAFSTLLRCTFDEALGAIADGTVDLLHIDGEHTFGAVRHDFQSWLPKLSDRAVVLFHDTNERREDFGVWRLWSELSERYPSFEFLHGHGLGVLAVGERPQQVVVDLCALAESAHVAALRARFAFLGERWSVDAQFKVFEREVQRQLDAATARTEEARAGLEQARADLQLQIERVRAEAQAEATRARDESERSIDAVRREAGNELARAADNARSLAEAVRLAQRRAEAAEATALAAAARAAAVEGSTIWRVTRPLRKIVGRFPRARRELRRVLRVGWWTATFQLPARLRERRAHRAQIHAVAESPLFDRDWYLAHYPDVAAAGIDPAVHYVKHGSVERRSPGPNFDSGWYLTTYPDVAASGTDPLLHYLTDGIREGRQARNIDSYAQWVHDYDTLSDADRIAIRAHIEELASHPTISVVVPVHDTDGDSLRDMIESVRQQIYPRWELCLADDASTAPHVRRVLEEFGKRDPRIKIIYRPENGQISAASNSALEMATGDFVALLDHDDVLAEHALYMVAHAINEHPDADIFYSDEDKLDAAGRRFDPYFKPDWNEELFYGQNFVSHLGVYRTSSMRAAGGFRVGFDGSQDYDLTLRLKAATNGPIVHIPHILYHWRIFAGATTYSSTQLDSATQAARRAITEHLALLGDRAIVTGASAGSYHRVIHQDPDHWPKVSVIVPTRDHVELLAHCLKGLLEGTDYPDLEVIVADNESIETSTEAFFAEVAGRGVRILPSPGAFNFSRINNAAAREAQGDVLLFLNNDISVIAPGWLKEMMRYAVRPGIGAVGARLLYPDGTIQHGGVVLGLGGIAGHIHRGASRNDPGYFGRLMLTQDVSCVTAACMAVPKVVFEKVGGFNEENLAVAFNDVDLCIRIREAGYRIVWTPYAELYHAESKSRGSDHCPTNMDRFLSEIAYMQRCWPRQIAEDPFFSPNLSLETVGVELAFPPRVRRPWLPVGTDLGDGE
jgi:GT2 family glycosyltransferase